MENKSTQQTFEASTPGQATSSFLRILSETSEQLTRNYERLKWIGFTSTAGVLIIIATFVLSAFPYGQAAF